MDNVKKPQIGKAANQHLILLDDSHRRERTLEMDTVKKPQIGKAANQNRAETEKHHRFLSTLENVRRLALGYLQSQVDDLIEHHQKVPRQELDEILDSIDGALEALRRCCQQGDRLTALIAAFGLLVAVDSAVLLAWEKPAARGRRILESAAEFQQPTTKSTGRRSPEQG